ncbi:MAG: hypothetical protein M8353_01505 [ANME-2 cluster archaeon]|nr:hypothetical protein [ANME-2 cluster archaeon]
MMIFPDDYKMVGIAHDDPTKKQLGEDPIYFATEYVIAYVPDGNIKIFKVDSEPTKTLLTKPVSFEVIAQGDEVVVHKTEHDAHNRTKLILLALDECKGPVNTVIFKGRDKHLTFVHKPSMCDVIKIEIIDVIPPEPPWLSFAIQRLVNSGILGELNITFEKTLIDLRQFEGDNVVFPCNASELNGKYLDTNNDIEDGSILVGCDISREIFELRFPEYTYRHVNMCPLKAQLVKPSKPFVTRCCQTRNTGLININGHDGVVVHWGASEYDIVDAIRQLVKRLHGEPDESGSY